MYFPPINAVDDGVFVFVGWSILSGYYGNQIWEDQYQFLGEQMRVVDIVAYTVNRFMPLFAIIAFKNIYLHRNSDHTKQLWNPLFFFA